MNIKKVFLFLYQSIRKSLQVLNHYNYSNSTSLCVFNYSEDDKIKVVWYFPKGDAEVSLSKNNAIVLINNIKLFLKWDILKNIHKTKIVDPNFYSLVEVSNWNSLLFSTYSAIKKEELLQLYKDNFTRMELKYKRFTKSSIFLSGPSISKYKDFDFSDSVNIICNSLVKDKELMSYVKPDILVFADPVFHFSHNEYAQKFREDMLVAVKEYDCFIVVPEFNAPLLLEHYPWLEKNIIALPFKNNINFPTISNFFVKGTDNILTLFMIPFASALTDKIYIIGADGRKKDETYFWKHNDDVQYSGLMQKAFDAHPSFFRDRNYKKYYDNHCNILEQIIEHGEKNKKSYFSLTKSYIPSLENRYRPEGLK